MILNLAGDTQILFTLTEFPDGQQQVKVNLLPGTKKVTIKSRLNNFMDLEKIVCANASLKEAGATEIHLYAPYFLGARSDRKFEDGSNNYLKNVICPIINLCGFSSVTTLDPHSDVLEACLNNFKRATNHEFVKQALIQINNRYDAQSNIVFISPDAGATKKIYSVAKHVNFGGQVVTCSKIRDVSGKIMHTEVPQFRANKDAIIIDDICDGGKTFIEIAKAMKGWGHSGEIYLIVTHGIFSKGIEELSDYFTEIHTTNSYHNFDVLVNTKIKHYNIF